MYRLFFIVGISFIFSCQDKSQINPIDPELSKAVIAKHILNPALKQSETLKQNKSFLKLNLALVKFKSEYPSEYKKFESISDDVQRATFLKTNRKFVKIWKKSGHNKKELMQIIHVKRTE